DDDEGCEYGPVAKRLEARGGDERDKGERTGDAQCGDDAGRQEDLYRQCDDVGPEFDTRECFGTGCKVRECAVHDAALLDVKDGKSEGPEQYIRPIHLEITRSCDPREALQGGRGGRTA